MVGCRFDTKYTMKVKGLHLSQRNIHHVKLGVMSLVVSSKHRDYGDIVTISIREKKTPKLKGSCKVSDSFYASFESCLPIRVIRGPTGGQYAPLIGYRYDGLYRVENAWDELCPVNKTIYHNFDLIRQRGQKIVYEPPPSRLPIYLPVNGIKTGLEHHVQPSTRRIRTVLIALYFTTDLFSMCDSSNHNAIHVTLQHSSIWKLFRKI